MDTTDSARNVSELLDGTSQLMRARAQFLEAVRSAPSSLTNIERLLAGFVTSAINGTSTDLELLRRDLTDESAPTWLVRNAERVAGVWPVCDDDRLSTIVDYVARLTRSPGTITSDDIRRLRTVALTDLDIVVLNNIVGAYNYLNRARAGLAE